jgi:hypothetical protein
LRLFLGAYKKMPINACLFFFWSFSRGEDIFLLYSKKQKTNKTIGKQFYFFYGGVNNSFYCLEKLEKINIPFINFLIINEPLKKDKSAPSTKATVTINDNL